MNGLFLTYTLLTSVFLLSGVLIILIQYLFNVLKKNNLYEKDIENIRKDIFNHSQHILDSAREKAQEHNINAIIIEDELQGDVISVSEYLIESALNFRSDKNEVKPVCILFGGETTLKMTGKGSGGRNQHLALLCAIQLQDKPGITILCAGTDGNDGPTKAAGAIVDSETIPFAISRGVKPEKFLVNFDSYNFFRKTSGHLITGPTMTNVMDIVAIIVDDQK